MAAELLAATDDGGSVPLLTERYPAMTWDDARQVARETDDLRLGRGERRIGWKLGWTSDVMREALGVDRPNWGTLWESQVVDHNANPARFRQAKVEPELVWRAPAVVAGPAVRVGDIIELGGEWALGLEVVDPRFPSFEFDALDNTADNSSSAGVRIGDFAPLPGDPALVVVDLTGDGERRSGSAAEAMGSPAEAVAWLARSLSDEGLVVEAGDIVFTGGLTRPFDVTPGSAFELRTTGAFPGPLPSVALRFD